MKDKVLLHVVYISSFAINCDYYSEQPLQQHGVLDG
jgi:hypothetical protein